jgi:hypothetical protein
MGWSAAIERLGCTPTCEVSSDHPKPGHPLWHLLSNLPRCTGQWQGVERQEEDCLAIAQRLGWTVVDRYIDNDTGASRYSKKKVRKHYLRLLADIEARQLDAVVIWMEDRLQRQVIELAEFLKVCDQAPGFRRCDGALEYGTPR